MGLLCSVQEHIFDENAEDVSKVGDAEWAKGKLTYCVAPPQHEPIISDVQHGLVNLRERVDPCVHLLMEPKPDSPEVDTPSDMQYPASHHHAALNRRATPCRASRSSAAGDTQLHPVTAPIILFTPLYLIAGW